MKERLIRSPGRKPPKGEEQAGVLARHEIEFESPTELERHMKSLAEDTDKRPFWDRQCTLFEQFARRFSDRELMIGGLTVEGKASEVLWWAGCLRTNMARGDGAHNVADSSMRLMAKIMELTVLANEPALLVGQNKIAVGSALTIHKQKKADTRLPALQKAATNIWSTHPRWKINAVAAEIVARKKSKGLKASYIAKLIKKPA